MGPDRNLNHLFPAFRAKIEALLEQLAAYASKHMPGYKWKLIEGFRTAEYQALLYARGRTKPGRIVTNCDGYRKRSNHQSGLAADLAPFKNGRPDWKCPIEHWEYLGHLARSHGLTWGGDWETLKDMPHVEWPRDDKTVLRDARKWVFEQPTSRV